MTPVAVPVARPATLAVRTHARHTRGAMPRAKVKQKGRRPARRSARPSVDGRATAGPVVEPLERRSLFAAVAAAAPTVTAFALVDPATNAEVARLHDGAVINLADLPGGRFSVRAITSPNPTGSVTFAVDGRPARTETLAPYALFGDDNGDYAGGTLPLGTHTLSATAHTGGGGTGTAGATASIEVSVVRQTKPNFVFVVADDMRYDAYGAAQKALGSRGRFPWLVGKTPNLDRLAAEGTRFANAFVTSSLCSPGRASMLTGQYNHQNGVVDNETPFPTSSVTYATQLQKAGYDTGYVGKWHMGTQSARPGFDYVASYDGQGEYAGTPFRVNGTRITPDGWVDDVATDYAIDFIKGEKGKPFSVTVGYKSPHVPRIPPDRLDDALAGTVLGPNPSPSATPGYDPTPAGGRDAESDRNYFRTILGVDQNVGRLLTTLDQLNLARNTVVVFTSDNGFLMGEHGLGDKRAAYEESMRVPLLVRYPKLAASRGKVASQMVLNVDFAPTLLDLGGVSVPAQMQGRSFKGVLAGTSTSWRSSWLYEYSRSGSTSRRRGRRTC